MWGSASRARPTVTSLRRFSRIGEGLGLLCLIGRSGFGFQLARRGTGRTLYLLDEPTTGLHLADVQKLLELLDRLVERGNTVIVIEHHLDVIKTADHVIDLGPEGGAEGGEIVVEGTPEAVAACARSHTGVALAAVLDR